MFSGTQAAGYNATGLSGQHLDFHAVPSAGQTSLEQVSENFYVSAADPNLTWDVLALLGNSGVVGQIGIKNGNASIGSNSVAITTGAWHNFQANVDFIAGTETAYVDGALIGQIPFFASGSTKLTGVATGINNTFGPSTSKAYVDNLSINSAPVQVLYSTGFEPPTYTTGTLSGQDGWTNNGGGSVETGTVFSGAQADGYNATGRSGQHLDFHTVPSAGQTSLERVTENFYVSAADPNLTWDVLALLGNSGVVGQIGIKNGNASIGGNSVAITTGAWHNFEAVVDFAAGTETAYVDGALIGSVPFFSPGSTKLTDVATGINNTFGPSTSQAYLDNVAIESVGVAAEVPEPSSLALVAFGFAGFAVIRRRGRPRDNTPIRR